MTKEKAHIKDLAKYCLCSYKEISAILEYECFINGKPTEQYKECFELKQKEYCLKKEFYEWFKHYILPKYHKIMSTDSKMVLGHQLLAYTDNHQIFFNIDEVCDKFNISEYDLFHYTNFYDTFNGIIITQQKNCIQRIITETGLYLCLYLMSNDHLKELGCA